MQGDPRDLEGKIIKTVNFSCSGIEIITEDGITWAIEPEVTTSSSNNRKHGSVTYRADLNWAVVREPKAHA